MIFLAISKIVILKIFINYY